MSCKNAIGIDECYTAIRSKKFCLFDGSNCVEDPCVNKNTADECNAADPLCIFTPWTTIPCNHRYFVCASISSAEACNANPLCAMSGQNCLYSVPTSYNSAAPKESECPGFPTWSIALLVVWILMIAIFGILFVLARKKSIRRSLEKSNISVDDVGNKDNFTTDLDERWQ